MSKTPVYTLYGLPKTRSVRVAWTLEEIGIPWQFVRVELSAGEHLNDAFKAISKTAKIPTLETPNGMLVESAAIVQYLAEKHALGELIPTLDDPLRGQFLQAMSFLVSDLELPLTNTIKHKFVLPAEKRVPAVLEVCPWEFTNKINDFGTLLGEQTYLCGEMFTVADIMAGHMLAWARSLGYQEWPQNVVEYRERILSRPAYERAWRKENGEIQD